MSDLRHRLHHGIQIHWTFGIQIIKVNRTFGISWQESALFLRQISCLQEGIMADYYEVQSRGDGSYTVTPRENSGCLTGIGIVVFVLILGLFGRWFGWFDSSSTDGSHTNTQGTSFNSSNVYLSEEEQFEKMVRENARRLTGTYASGVVDDNTTRNYYLYTAPKTGNYVFDFTVDKESAIWFKIYDSSFEEVCSYNPDNPFNYEEEIKLIGENSYYLIVQRYCWNTDYTMTISIRN